MIHDLIPGSAAAIQQIAVEGGVWGDHGNVIIADTIEELAQRVADAGGTYRGASLRTIEEYNAAVDAGNQEDLPVPHYPGNGSGGFAISTPPFLCNSGRRRTLFLQPLWEVFKRGAYMGAIASAGTFGYLAGRHAVKSFG